MKLCFVLLVSVALAGCCRTGAGPDACPRGDSPSKNGNPAAADRKTETSPQRHAWITGLNPEKAARYRDLHAHPWPGVNRMLKQCHIQNFSIHECKIDGKLYLFAYLEYTGDDFDADMKKMGDDPETQRWWQQTDPCQTPLPEAAAKKKIWTDMTEVYYLR